MTQYVALVKRLIKYFKKVKIEQIPWAENTKVDAMANLGVVTGYKNMERPIIYVML